MRSVRILIADDHALVRAGIRALLESTPEFSVVAEASDGHEALEMMAQESPDVSVVDISMAGLNGLEVTARALDKNPRSRILILTMHNDPEYVHRALLSGAAGYLLKNANKDELEQAIRTVAGGEIWISPGISRSVVSALQKQEQPSTPIDVLTPRQREILQLIAEGNSTKEIAQRLHLSTKTVETHRAQMMERLGVRGIPALVRLAIRFGIVPPEA